MVTEPPTHRQYNPLFVLSKGAALMRESAAILSRKAKGRPEPVWLKSELLPKYFQNTFHFQTDGWLSQRSAQVGQEVGGEMWICMKLMEGVLGNVYQLAFCAAIIPAWRLTSAPH